MTCPAGSVRVLDASRLTVGVVEQGSQAQGLQGLGGADAQQDVMSWQGFEVLEVWMTACVHVWDMVSPTRINLKVSLQGLGRAVVGR